MFARGQEGASPAAVLLIGRNPFIFPNQFVFVGAQVAGAPSCPASGKSATAPVWCWVTFGKQSRVISRVPKPTVAESKNTENQSATGARLCR